MTDARDIQHLEKDDLLRLQMRGGLGSEWGVLDFPVEWMADGPMKSVGQRVLDIRRVCHVVEGKPLTELVVATVTRFALISLVTSLTSNGGQRYLAPSTVVSGARKLCHVIRSLLKKQLVNEERIFGLCNASALLDICRATDRRTVVNRIMQLRARGYWQDAPELLQGEDEGTKAESTSAWESDDAKNASETADAGCAEPKRSSPFLPLSDDLVAELGWRCIWFLRHGEPAIAQCAKAIVDDLKGFSRVEGRPVHTYNKRATNRVKGFLSTYQWKSDDGRPIEELPFSLDFRGAGNREPFCWPPRNLVQVRCLLGVAQSMHLVVALLSMAGRISEILSLNGNDYSSKTLRKEEVVEGRTFKGSDSNQGQPRDWPMPEILALALERQRDLAPLLLNLSLKVNCDYGVGSHATDAMWIGLQSKSAVTAGYNHMLVQLIKILGLTELLDDSNVHAHRFRKTIARLMALAIVGAPKIVMDFFGHESIEMTLGYMLTDPLIRLEMEQVAKAQTIMFAKEAIAGAENCGGPAAAKLRAAVDDQCARLGSELGEDDISRLAETLTLSGTHWMLVRPGVICTKLPQQSGPCNASQGRPDAAKCRSSCDHRLEMAILKQDVDNCIRIAVGEIKKAEKADDEIGVEAWRGQVLANLERFPDLSKKWSKNRVVSALLKTTAARH
ncbi:hypothetical protein ACXIVK_26880 [Paraburkholderia caledonica]